MSKSSAIKAIDVDVIPSGDVVKAVNDKSNHCINLSENTENLLQKKVADASSSTGPFIPDVTKDCYNMINGADLIHHSNGDEYDLSTYSNRAGFPENLKLLKENCSEKVKFKVQSPLFNSDDFTFSDDESDHDGYASDQSTKGKEKKSKLEWTDDTHEHDSLHRMDVFRRCRQFCDLTLHVDSRELHCHRVVVGGLSRTVFDELAQKSNEMESNGIQRIVIDPSWGLQSDAVEVIINFMYTSKLVIPGNLLHAVYKACFMLSVDRVIPLCRNYVIADLNPEQSVIVRGLASTVRDYDLKEYVDRYIEEKFDEVEKTNEFLALPRVKVEVVYSATTTDVALLSSNFRDHSIASLVLSWLYEVTRQRGECVLQDLSEQIQRVDIDELSNLVCVVESAEGSGQSNDSSFEAERRLSKSGGRRQSVCGSDAGSRTARQDSIPRSSSRCSLASSLDSFESTTHVRLVPHGEWKVIASSNPTAEHLVALCQAGGVLCTFSIRLPTNLRNVYENGFGSTASSTRSSCSSYDGSAFGRLGNARCAFGVESLDGKVFAVGGYNRSECLDSTEIYNVLTKLWSFAAPMPTKRARFQTVFLNGYLYAVGGSSGSGDLAEVDRYDPATDTWTSSQRLLTRCSESAVAVLHNRLYCVGGAQQSTGVAAMKTCQVYDPEQNTWSHTTQLATGRKSLGLLSFNGYLFAIGGSDGWKCLQTTERYDPSTQQWSTAAPLHVNRRGMGVAVHNESMYCAGGSDGVSFLTSVEKYSALEGDVWVLLNSQLNIPRSNVGLSSVNGNLFAIGGFSGRDFLASIEYLDEENDRWTGYDCQQSTPSVISEKSENDQ